MLYHRRLVLQCALLLAIGLRTVFGAPCCLPPVEAGQADHALHAQHDSEPEEGHSGHGDDPSANPCCSACGPTLPSDPVNFTTRETVRVSPAPAPIRTLATRPPFPAYDARGPPLLI